MKMMYRALAVVATLLFATPVAAENCPSFAVEGTGPDVILVPGLASSPATYDGLVEALKDRFRFHRITLAGFAGRPAEQAGAIDTAEDEIVRYISCAGLERPALIGHSLGGFVGIKVASGHSALLSRLIVVDALPFYSLIMNANATPTAMKPAADALAAQMRAMDAATFAAGQARTAAMLSASEEGQKRIVEWSEQSDRDAMADAVHRLMTSDLRGDIARITIPVTVLYAVNDYVPEARAKPLFEGAYASLQGTRFVLVADSRHFIMFDQPDRFTEEVGKALMGSVAR